MTVRQIAGDHETVDDVLRAGASVNADVEAYVEPACGPSPRRAVTFGQWDRAADGVAGFLARRGVGRGSVVCLMLPSSITYMIVYAAAIRLGAVTSGVNLRLGTSEIASILGRIRPTVTVTEDGSGHEPTAAARAGSVVWRSEIEQAADDPPPPNFSALDASEPVAVVWTSGTTGVPKGAVFDHGNLAAVARGTDALSRPGDRRLSPLPFAHVGSMTRIWDEIAHGVTTVITPSPWRASDALSVIESERITVGQGVPTQWALVLAEPSLAETDCSTLRIVGTGGATVPSELVAAVRSAFGVPVVVRYTSTEASLGTGTDPGDPDHVVASTVGRPVPGVSLSILDDDGREAAAGSIGRVRLRSAAVMRGYWGGLPRSGRGVDYDSEATEEVLGDDGWLTTGDFGRIGEDGCLRLVGRTNEQYQRGGYNVYPVEVERVLERHHRVSRAAVVGTPDPVLGEIGVAFVVPAADSGPAGDEGDRLVELRALVCDVLADYKAPDALVILDELPLTSMLKVDKRALADEAARAAARKTGRTGAREESAASRPGTTTATRAS